MLTDEMIFAGIETNILSKRNDIQEDFWEGHYWIFDIDMYEGEVPIYTMFDYWIVSEYSYDVGKCISKILHIVSPYTLYGLNTYHSDNEKYIKEYIERIWIAISNRIKREICDIAQSKNRIPTIRETHKAIQEIMKLKH